jgi:hypothetical protein
VGPALNPPVVETGANGQEVFLPFPTAVQSPASTFIPIDVEPSATGGSDSSSDSSASSTATDTTTSTTTSTTSDEGPTSTAIDTNTSTETLLSSTVPGQHAPTASVATDKKEVERRQEQTVPVVVQSTAAVVVAPTPTDDMEMDAPETVGYAPLGTNIIPANAAHLIPSAESGSGSGSESGDGGVLVASGGTVVAESIVPLSTGPSGVVGVVGPGASAVANGSSYGSSVPTGSDVPINSAVATGSGLSSGLGNGAMPTSGSTTGMPAASAGEKNVPFKGIASAFALAMVGAAMVMV